MTKINKLHDKFERGVLKVVGKSPIIGRSLAKVLKPALDAAKSGREGVDKFSKTKAGKIILTAVAIYFGGAALSGAMGGGAAAATGATGWAGAAQGLSGAWTGIMQAGSAVAAGEFGAAGSALSTGMAGGSAGFTAAEAGTMAVPELGMIGQVGADGAALALERQRLAAKPWPARLRMPRRRRSRRSRRLQACRRVPTTRRFKRLRSLVSGQSVRQRFRKSPAARFHR